VTHLIATNGLEMFCTDEGDGPALVLLHGFTGSGENWKLVFPDGIPAHRVITVDLRGHGRSTNPSGLFTFRECARDVIGLLDHLGIDRFSAIGMSAGAKTMLHVASEVPSRVESMVLVSATPRFPDQARAAMRAMAADAQTPDAFKRMVAAMADSRDDMNFTRDSLAAIRARTLIVHGDRDPLYPVELALEMYRAIPDSQLWIVPNGGHGPIFGSFAPPFSAAALAFLKPEA
jgi:pimeloyl-ACP methyl ester carboxylesterase